MGDEPHNLGIIDLYPTGGEILDKSLLHAIQWKSFNEGLVTNVLLALIKK